MKAIIDNNNILRGFSSDPEATGIDVPDGCDLVAGESYWDQAMGSWMPIIEPVEHGDGTPSFQNAMYLLVKSLDGKVTLSPETLSWAEEFKSSCDARVSFDNSKE